MFATSGPKPSTALTADRPTPMSHVPLHAEEVNQPARPCSSLQPAAISDRDGQRLPATPDTDRNVNQVML